MSQPHRFYCPVDSRPLLVGAVVEHLDPFRLCHHRQTNPVMCLCVCVGRGECEVFLYSTDAHINELTTHLALQKCVLL